MTSLVRNLADYLDDDDENDLLKKRKLQNENVISNASSEDDCK